MHEFSSTSAIELLGLSDAMGIDSLKTICEKTLVSSVDNENVISLLIHAHRCNANELKDFSLTYLVKNFK